VCFQKTNQKIHNKKDEANLLKKFKDTGKVKRAIKKLDKVK
jgi:hypothetical protein